MGCVYVCACTYMYVYYKEKVNKLGRQILKDVKIEREGFLDGNEKVIFENIFIEIGRFFPQEMKDYIC